MANCIVLLSNAGRAAPEENLIGAQQRTTAPATPGPKAYWWQTALLAAFFASGTSGLVLELVWTRQFALVFGTAEAALSTVLAAYMAGIAIGSYVFGRWCRSWVQPLWLYAFLEGGVALFAFFLGSVVTDTDSALRTVWAFFPHHSTLFAATRFLLAFIMVVIPTTLMGGTLPSLCQAWPKTERTPEHHLGLLYAANLLGGVGGVFTAGFLLIPHWGVQKTALFAGLSSLLAALVAVLTALLIGPILTGTFQSGRESPHSENEDRIAGLRRTVVLFSVGISGFSALIQEVIWSRALRLVMGSSTYALTLMLLVFLLGLGLGSYLVARASHRIRSPVRLLARLQGAVYLSLFLAVYLYPSLPRFFLLGFSALGGGTGVFVLQALLAGCLLLPSAVLLGTLFPLSARVFAREPSGSGPPVGKLYAVQTSGNAFGAAFTIVWIAQFGLHGGLLAAAMLHLGAGLALWFVAEAQVRSRVLAGVAIAAVALLVPLIGIPWQPLVMTSGVYQSTTVLGGLFSRPQDFFKALSRFRLLFYQEGETATVSVYERPTVESRRHIALAIDGKVDASTGADMSTQVLSAHLPLLLFPEAKDVCVVGWASGVTAGSALLHPVSNVTAMEIEPAVLSASSAFDEFNGRPRSDPRLRIVIGDARNLLLLEKHRYDIIISEPSNPWLSGPAKLFTEEFFRLGSHRLNRGGIFAQWIQLYGLDPSLLRSVFRTFHSVFPFVLVFQTAEGDLLLLGRLSPITVDPGAIEHLLADPKIGTDLARVHMFDSVDLLTRFRLGWNEVGAFAELDPVNSDDHPLLEFEAPKSLYHDTVEGNLRLLRSSFHGIMPYLSLPDSKIPVRIAQRAILRRNWDAAEMFGGEVRTLPPSADRAWILGEIEWKHKNYITAERWWQEGIALDPHHFGCLLSKAIADQQLGKFTDAEVSLEHLSRQWPGDAFVALIHGINRLALRDAHGAIEYFLWIRRQPTSASEKVGSTDSREAVLGRFLPLPVLVSFYSAQAAAQEGDERSAHEFEKQALSGLEHWKASLLANPSMDSRALLLDIADLLSSRAAAIASDRVLLDWISKSLFEPLSHYDRAVSLALLGHAAESEVEFAQAVAEVTDNEGRAQIATVCRKLAEATGAACQPSLQPP
jgi:spermidine synthase